MVVVVVGGGKRDKARERERVEVLATCTKGILSPVATDPDSHKPQRDRCCAPIIT